MKIPICRKSDKEAQSLVEFAQRMNQRVFEDDRFYYVQIGEESTVWRAPDAQFRRVPSGTYMFKTSGDERNERVECVRVL